MLLAGDIQWLHRLQLLGISETQLVQQPAAQIVQQLVGRNGSGGVHVWTRNSRSTPQIVSEESAARDWSNDSRAFAYALPNCCSSFRINESSTSGCAIPSVGSDKTTFVSTEGGHPSRASSMASQDRG